MGLLILASVYRSRGESTRCLWDDRSGHAIFRATMSLSRFSQSIQIQDHLNPPRLQWKLEMMMRVPHPHQDLTVLSLRSDENKRLPPQQSGCAPIPWDNTDKAEKGEDRTPVRLDALRSMRENLASNLADGLNPN
ncbi:hypothetical protein F2P79_024698 [Pimephales promelas]|nr:hypothetical protein F2P79_024698 [Pimephales promelas]